MYLRDIGQNDLEKELYIPDKAEKADFSRNQIQIIDSSIFKWTRGLRELSFSRNDIIHIWETSFSNLTELQLLDLSHNRLDIEIIRFGNIIMISMIPLIF